MSSLHNDLHSWAAKARANGLGTIHITVETADKISEALLAQEPATWPARPAGHCDDSIAWEQFTKDYGNRSRADLGKGDLSDFALANAQFMCDRNSLDLIVYQTAAKERIRWLSIQLARALGAAPSENSVTGVTLTAETVIAMRDALIRHDVEEAYHQLYQAVDPTFCRYEPWADTEAKLRPSPTETVPRGTNTIGGMPVPDINEWTVKPAADDARGHPIGTVPHGDQVLIWEPMYGWLVGCFNAFGSGQWQIKSSGNFWEDLPKEVVPTHWRPLPMPSEQSYPTWIVTQERGQVPRRKGPFYGRKMVEDFLREAYSLIPDIVCIVLDLETDDNTWWPEHGYEWLDINGDGRRRHPRKDRPNSHVTVEDYARRLFDLHGFMLLETYQGKHAVTVTFPDLAEAQQFHTALVELSTHKPRATAQENISND